MPESGVFRAGKKTSIVSLTSAAVRAQFSRRAGKHFEVRSVLCEVRGLKRFN